MYHYTIFFYDDWFSVIFIHITDVVTFHIDQPHDFSCHHFHNSYILLSRLRSSVTFFSFNAPIPSKDLIPNVQTICISNGQVYSTHCKKRKLFKMPVSFTLIPVIVTWKFMMKSECYWQWCHFRSYIEPWVSIQSGKTWIRSLCKSEKYLCNYIECKGTWPCHCHFKKTSAPYIYIYTDSSVEN